VKKNVLIVEDESIVSMEIASFVNEIGFNVCCIASSANKAYEALQENSVDLILMDVYIKGDIDGITCAKEIKSQKDIPLIYISAFSDDETLDRAIETQPSAYLIKPFNRKELKVAMRIATKKNHDNLKVGDIIFDEEFSYDTQNSELILKGEIIHLTKQEKLLLELLIGAKNTVTIYELENYLWPNKESNENTRRALIARLRAKLKYKFLETVHSIGYKINI
jgi:DNA-binding response OmpR family regulator